MKFRKITRSLYGKSVLVVSALMMPMVCLADDGGVKEILQGVSSTAYSGKIMFLNILGLIGIAIIALGIGIWWKHKDTPNHGKGGLIFKCFIIGAIALSPQPFISHVAKTTSGDSTNVGKNMSQQYQET